ncbi:unnamed protein product [Schistosoma margrebowiei]|uniref:UPAR/Ly6 domain-containing protein n=1 Tax=Schistosoma margrebowiei TaxID=48269 RepID=A0AA84ZRW2_9TREM|nr:unnamed protein product [Schistosoma margrebowiei]
MESNIQIILMILVFVVNTDYTFSVKCYRCNLCPVPMDYSSPLVTVISSCKWCASLTIGSPHLTMKGCSDSCSSDSFLKKYVRFNYTCCGKNFCNLSSKAHPTNQILFLPVMIICFYLYARK